jgi:proteasome lid subunit RPN8/RPN11
MISKILYVVHSHYMQDCKPSEHDKNNCKAVGIPYLIVSYPEKKEYIYDPS